MKLMERDWLYIREHFAIYNLPMISELFGGKHKLM